MKSTDGLLCDYKELGYISIKGFLNVQDKSSTWNNKNKSLHNQKNQKNQVNLSHHKLLSSLRYSRHVYDIKKG